MSDAILTLTEFMEEQRRLEEEAAELLPLKFDKCSYSQGRVRQDWFSCLDCGKKDEDGKLIDPVVVCYGCSISCHTSHTLEELWMKRGLRCDCPTDKTASTNLLIPDCCSLISEKFRINSDNQYEPFHNYLGRYCWCDSSYEPEKIEEVEDAAELKESVCPDPSMMIQCFFCEDWYHARCISDLPDLDKFSEFVCKDCVQKNGFLQIFADQAAIILKNSAEKEQKDASNSSEFSKVCLKQFSSSYEASRNIYLMEDWRRLVCSCIYCKAVYPSFFVAEENVFVPEEDLDRFKCSEEAAISALDKVERSKFIKGYESFQCLGSSLKHFLKPFADKGVIVTSSDVQEFFEKEKRRRII